MELTLFDDNGKIISETKRIGNTIQVTKYNSTYTDRDCKNCIYANWNGNDNGCTKWDCEYTPKDEVIAMYEAMKEKK